MSDITAQIQKLEPGALLEFWEIDATEIGGGIARFQGHSEGAVYWQGNQYDALPITGDGFARTSEQQPTPRLMVGNVNGAISLLCLQYEDLLGAIITRRRTFAKFIDAINFPDGNPFADPDQEYEPEIWYIERKAGESSDSVDFELSSALDFGGMKLPARQIVANQCPAQWVYRGENCGYTGPPVADALDNPTSDPALDRCGRRLRSCKMRVWPGNVLNFGGFPAAGLVRT